MSIYQDTRTIIYKNAKLVSLALGLLLLSKIFIIGIPFILKELIDRLTKGQVSNFPEINAVPTTYLFDRDGKSQLVAFAEGKVLTTDDFANIFIPALKKLIDTLLRQATGV